MAIIPDNYLQTSYLWNVSDIDEINVNSPEFKELLIRLFQNINQIANAVNSKDNGSYYTSEFVNGQLFFPLAATAGYTETKPRNVLRKVIDFGALPNTGTTNVAHGITTDGNTIFTRIYGCATDPTAQIYLPLPYSSPTLVNNIELSVTNTNAVITTGANYAAYTTTYVIIEYIQA